MGIAILNMSIYFYIEIITIHNVPIVIFIPAKLQKPGLGNNNLRPVLTPDEY